MLAAPGAEAQSYRCVGKDGKRYYGSVVPHECYGLPIEQLNAQGMIVRRIDPAGSEKERLAKEAAETKKREEDRRRARRRAATARCWPPTPARGTSTMRAHARSPRTARR